MNELLSLEQEISVVPKDFKNSNKGKIAKILDKSFAIALAHPPVGLEDKHIVEFYSHTKHGTLYFTSPIVQTDGNILVVLKPRKHRFLQRRAFSRVKFVQELELKLGDKIMEATTKDIAVGGVKLTTKETPDINARYEIVIKLPGGEVLDTTYEPIKIEKSEDGAYTVAGRFVDVPKKDKMKIVQFCMRKDIEYNKDKYGQAN